MAKDKAKDKPKKSTQTTLKKREKFLEVYRQVGVIKDAAQIAGIDRTTVYLWKEDEEFAKQFEEAKEEANETLEREAIRRASEGVDEPVFYQGMICGYKRNYSDTLLMFLLKGNKPDKYADRVKGEIESTNTNHNINEDVNALTTEERRARIDALNRKGRIGTADAPRTGGNRKRKG